MSFENRERKEQIDTGTIRKFSVLFGDLTAILFPFEHPISQHKPSLSEMEIERREQMMQKLYSSMGKPEEFEKAKEIMIDFIKELDSLLSKEGLIVDLPVEKFDELLGKLSRAASHISQAFHGIPREEWRKHIPSTDGKYETNGTS